MCFDLQGTGTGRGLPMDVLPTVSALVATNPVNQDRIGKNPAMNGNVTLPAKSVLRQFILSKNGRIDKEPGTIRVDLLTGRTETEKISCGQCRNGAVIIAPADTVNIVPASDAAVWTQMERDSQDAAF